MPGMQSGLSSMMIGTGGHAIPDPRPVDARESAGMPLEAGGPVAPAPPTPLPASGMDFSPAAPALNGTYRSTVQIPPPPLLDSHAPPPLSAGWAVHDVAKPAVPGPTVAPASAAVDYVVRDGDDLTTIALKVYGHAGAATAIWDANRDRVADPRVLPIGMALRLPPTWTLPAAHGPQGGSPGRAIEPTFSRGWSGDQARRGGGREPAAPTAAGGAEPFWLQGSTGSPPTSSATPTSGHAQRPSTVRVGMGDSLESIAVRFYGDRAMGSRIWEANRDRLRSPDLLVPGAELRLP
jgi:nucleoid-associated protein YgaU